MGFIGENAQSVSMHRCNFIILDVGTVLRRCRDVSEYFSLG